MAKSKTIQVGLIGLGRAGIQMHCKELEKYKGKFKLVAGCDSLKERRDEFAETYKASAYKNVDDLVNDPQVELVDIASRSTEHAEHAIKALKAGKLVFLEKPISITYKEAKKIEAAAKKSKGKIFIRHNRRFEPAFQHIREIIASGILGDVYEIKLRRNSFSWRDDWQTVKKAGGGQLLNWGPHIVDHALRLLESPVKSQWSDLKSVACAGDAEDHLKIILTGRNNRIIDLEISGASALGEPEYLVHGSRGALRCSGQTINMKYINPRQKTPDLKAKLQSPDLKEGYGGTAAPKWVEKEIKVNPKLKVEMTKIWQYLYEAIRERKKFPITLEESVEVMKVIDDAKKETKFEIKNR
jgi:scyllo-inositol 2-dehydrogenase (NADP+)